MIFNNKINKDISEKIRNIRLNNNLSQDRFGKKIGVTGKTISAYETGKCCPSVKILDSICSTYNTYILSSDEKRKETICERLNFLKQSIIEIEKILVDKLSL